MILVTLHGRVCYLHRGRYFAVDKLENRAGRIAIDSHECLRGNIWQRVLSQPSGSRVLINQKRADARRDARMRKLVVRARFT